tara:strand:+ start:10579 stop:11112 length:534 start_codon:yes stop_codon:yes gene_type:complete
MHQRVFMSLAHELDFLASEVVRNMDFVLRNQSERTYLITADYAKEPLKASAVYLARELNKTYGHNILVLDFNPAQSDSSADYTNISTLDFLPSQPNEQERELKIYQNECLKHYDFIFALPHVKLQTEKSSLPLLDLEAAFILRSKSSLLPTSKKILTHMIQDAQLKIAGIVAIGGKA